MPQPYFFTATAGTPNWVPIMTLFDHDEASFVGLDVLILPGCPPKWVIKIQNEASWSQDYRFAYSAFPSQLCAIADTTDVQQALSTVAGWRTAIINMTPEHTQSIDHRLDVVKRTYGIGREFMEALDIEGHPRDVITDEIDDIAKLRKQWVEASDAKDKLEKRLARVIECAENDEAKYEESLQWHKTELGILRHLIKELRAIVKYALDPKDNKEYR